MPPGRLNRPRIRPRNYAADLRDLALQQLRDCINDLRSMIGEFSDFLVAYSEWFREFEAEFIIQKATMDSLLTGNNRLKIETLVAHDRAKIAGNEEEAARLKARYEELWEGEERPKGNADTLRQLRPMYVELHTMFSGDEEFFEDLGERFNKIIEDLDEKMPDMLELLTMKDAGVDVEEIEGYWAKSLGFGLHFLSFMDFMQDVLDYTQSRMFDMKRKRLEVAEELEHIQMQLARHSAELYRRQSGRQGRRRAGRP